MRKELYFTAFGVPKPQGSKRHVGNGRMIEASDVKPWRKTIASAVFSAWVATGDERPFTEPVVVWATFYLPKPRTVKRLLPSVPPDLDKLCRALGDALSIDSNALSDDSLIVKWHASKLYADNPQDAGVRVAIKRATAEELAAINNQKDTLEFSSEVCDCCGK
jgi:crossover junction endodeoxyribonuclease RusA